MAFPIKVICFISDLQTHLGLLCSELSKSRGPVKPSAQAEAGVDPAQAGTLPPTRLESLGQRGLGPSLSLSWDLLCAQPRLLLPALLWPFSVGPPGPTPESECSEGAVGSGLGQAYPPMPLGIPAILPSPYLIFSGSLSVQA